MSKRFRLLIILVVLAIAGVFLYPSFEWYFLLTPQQRQLALSSNQQIRFFARSQATATLEKLVTMAAANSDAAIPKADRFVIDAARENYRLAREPIPSKWTAQAVLGAFVTRQDAYNAIEDHFRREVLGFKNGRGDIMQLGLDLSGGMSVLLRADMSSLEKKLGHPPTAVDKQQAMDRAMEILNNRIDKFGVTEPIIRQQGNDEIAIEIPGPADPERVHTFLTGKGSLTFHIEDDQATNAVQQYIAAHPGDAFNAEGQLKDPSLIPAGDAVYGFYKQDKYGVDQLVNYVVLKKEIGLDGEHITGAQVGTDPVTNQPIITFSLDPEGADIFYKLTSANVGKQLAIVLDGKVKAGARIQEAIRGNVQMTGFGRQEATNLAIVLRTASMPVDLVVESQEAVGASLGADAIHQGLLALAFGFLLVVVFMAGYYRVAGLIADLELVLDMVIMLAILSAFNLTLTLTSMAGLILTIGMAVDANVLIYERMKEELNVGKSVEASIRAGFRKAFWTIMDTHVTALVAAVFLSQLGTGPVQGFAYTLAVGIVCSLFTALFVSRLIFDFFLETLHLKKVAIDWRKR